MSSVTTRDRWGRRDQRCAFQFGRSGCPPYRRAWRTRSPASEPPQQWPRLEGDSRCWLVSQPERAPAGRREAVGRPCFAGRRR